MEVELLDDDVICLSDDDCDESIIFIEEISGASRKKKAEDSVKSQKMPVAPTRNCPLHNHKVTKSVGHDLVVEVSNTSKQDVPATSTKTLKQTHCCLLHKVTKSSVHNMMEVSNTSKSAKQHSIPVTPSKPQSCPTHNASNVQPSSQHYDYALSQTNKSSMLNAELEIRIPGSSKKRSVKLKNVPPSSSSCKQSSKTTELSTNTCVSTVAKKQAKKTVPDLSVELTRQKCPFIGCRFTCIQRLFPETMVMHLQQSNHTQLNFNGLFEFANKISVNEDKSRICLDCGDVFLTELEAESHPRCSNQEKVSLSTVSCFACPACFLLFPSFTQCFQHMDFTKHVHHVFPLTGDGESTVLPLPIQEKCYDAIMDIILERNVTGFICVECNQGFDLKDKTEMIAHMLLCKTRLIPNPSGSMTSVLDTLLNSPSICCQCGTTLTKRQMNTHNEVCPKNNPQEPLWARCTTIKDLLVTFNKLLSQHSYPQTPRKRQCVQDNPSSKRRKEEKPSTERQVQTKIIDKKGLDIKVTLNSQPATRKTWNPLPVIPSINMSSASFSVYRDGRNRSNNNNNNNNNNKKRMFGHKKSLLGHPPYPTGLGYQFPAQRNVPGNFNFTNATANPSAYTGRMQTRAWNGSSNRCTGPFGTTLHSGRTSKSATISLAGSLGKCDVNQNTTKLSTLSTTVPVYSTQRTALSTVTREVLGTSSSHENSNSSTSTGWVGPSLKFLESMAQIILVDLDNWPGFFSKLMAPLPNKTFVWGFHAQKTNWFQPRNCMAFDRICQQGCFQLHPQSGNTKDAADFALCMQAGKLDGQLPLHIPFSILSGDKAFFELKKQLENGKRKCHILNPHDRSLANDMFYAVIASITES